MMNQNTPALSVFPRLALCLVIGCLALHFLVEDALLFQLADLTETRLAETFTEACEEFEHLDDLAYMAGPPDRAGERTLATAFARTAFLKEQVWISIFKPPKF
jgi:hypothetical protein